MNPELFFSSMITYELYFAMAAANTKHTNIQSKTSLPNTSKKKNIHATIKVKKEKKVKKHN